MKTASLRQSKKAGSASRTPFFQKNGAGGSFFQAKLTVGKSNDNFEAEADRAADHVVQNNAVTQPYFKVSPLRITSRSDPGQTIGKQADDQMQDKEAPEMQMSGLLGQKETSQEDAGSEGFVQFRGKNGHQAPTPKFESALSASKGGGKKLPDSTRTEMEAGIGYDFSDVRTHTDALSVSMNNEVGARAFTHGKDIYFNEGQLNTNSREGKHLLAHELTHTVQQGSGIRKSGLPANASVPAVQLLPGWILEELNDYARYIPGWTLFTVIIGFNPLLGRSVARSAQNLVRGLLELIPVFGILLYDKLNELGILDAAFNWVNAQLDELDLSLDRLNRTVEQAWDEVSIIRGLSYNIGVLERTFGALYRDVVTFASRVGDKILQLIRDALISFLKSFAESIPGYTLLTKIISKDPLTDTPVEATTAEIIADFLMLIGAERELQKMQEEGTLQETADWIDEQ